MDSTIWKGIYGAVEEGNIYTVIEYVTHIAEQIAEKWLNGLHEDFERELRLCIQKSQRLKRDLVDEHQEIPYQLGMVAGYVRAFEQIYRSEGEQQNIVESLAQSSGKTRQILNRLYQERERGMQHSTLAEAIGSTPSSLSNLMKRVLLSGAVESSRNGKNTYYMLTPAGERYCIQAQKKQLDQGLSKEMIEGLTKSFVEAFVQNYTKDKKDQVPTQKLGTGDIFIAPENSAPGKMYQVKSIANLGGIKYIEAIKASLEGNNSSESRKELGVTNLYQNIPSLQSTR